MDFARRHNPTRNNVSKSLVPVFLLSCLLLDKSGIYLVFHFILFINFLVIPLSVIF